MSSGHILSVAYRIRTLSRRRSYTNRCNVSDSLIRDTDADHSILDQLARGASLAMSTESSRAGLVGLQNLLGARNIDFLPEWHANEAVAHNDRVSRDGKSEGE